MKAECLGKLNLGCTDIGPSPNYWTMHAAAL